MGGDDRKEQVEESWIPNTPFNKQGYQIDEEQLNRFKSTGFETWSACSNSNWEIALQTKGDIQVLNGTQLNFTSLLALQDQASATAFRNDDYQLESNGLWSDNFRHNSQSKHNSTLFYVFFSF